jgi:hypothetical protein
MRSGVSALVATIFALALASCGGGNVNTTPVSQPNVTPTAPALQSLTAFAPVGVNATVPASAAFTFPTLTPPAGVDAGLSGAITMPAQTAGGTGATAQATMQTSLPAGAPALASLARAEAQSLRSTQNEAVPVTGIVFFTETFIGSAKYTFSAPPSLVVGLPAGYFTVPGIAYYISLYDPTQPTAAWQSRFMTCTPAAGGNFLSCVPTNSGTYSVVGNASYSFALYAVSTSATAPTPAPTASPVAPPTIAPTSISATLTGSAQTITLPAVTSGVSGSVAILGSSAQATLTGTAQVTPGNGYAPSAGGTPTTLYSALFTTSTAVSVTGGFTATFTLPQAGATGTRYILATYDSRYGWFYGIAGPGTVSGTTVTITSPLPASFVTGATYGVALYALPSAGAASGTVTLATGATLTLPASSGATGSITLGTVSASTTAPVTLFLEPPAGVPNPGTTYPAALYYVFTPAATVTISGTSTASFTAPTGYGTGFPSGISAYIEMYDTSRPTSGWFFKAIGPATTGGPSVSFSTTQSMTLTGGVTYAFAVYPSF